MTLTPAIKEALDDLRERIVLHNYVECQENCTSLELRHHKELVAKAETHLLSVVAAEEGRKYEQLVKLHREWKEARVQLLATEEQFVASETRREALARYQRAIDALAQWEAL